MTSVTMISRAPWARAASDAEHADRAAAGDQHALVEQRAGAVDRVQRHRKGLGERALGEG